MRHWLTRLIWTLTRAVVFRLSAERAHRWIMGGMGFAPMLAKRLLRLLLGPTATQRPIRLGPLCLRGPVGLAAGLDKDGEAILVWPTLGFGFIEVGSVTWHPQPGNPKPRLFRLVPERGLINRMGFNNHGAQAMADHLTELRQSGRWPHIPVGVNIGKSKITPLEEAVADYESSARVLKDVADYLVINVSSPNTPGLRGLQHGEILREIIQAVTTVAEGLPVLVKLSPDLDDEGLDAAVQTAVDCQCAGIIATNTTLQRPDTTGRLDEDGGLSGTPIWPISRQRIQRVLERTAGRIPVVGSGGIDSASKAQELLDAGCIAVQVYSALVFRGPGLIHEINKGLSTEST